MVGVRLDTGYIHRAGNPSEQIRLPYKTVSSAVGARGKVAQYAAGVRRSITWPGKEPELEIEAPYVPFAEATTLQQWVGEVVVWRDLQGRVTWGLLADADMDWNPSFPDNRAATVKLEIIPTTQTAEV